MKRGHLSHKHSLSEGRETALHAAARIGSEKKIEILLQHGADLNKLWIGETYLETKQKYQVLESLTKHTIPTELMKEPEKVIQDIRSCRLFMLKDETRDIAFNISYIMTQVCSTVSICLNKDLQCKISGSFLENSKCFASDELDFVFWTKSDIRYDKYIGIATYYCIDSLIRSNHPSTHSPDPRLQLVCLRFGNKISSLLFKWKGIEFPDLDIKVDVAVCDKIEIAKQSRFMEDDYIGHKRHKCSELSQLMSGLKRHEKQGFILAKAVRIASIAQPDNLDSFDLEENINVDDVITSFLLRMCLPNEKDNKDEFEDCSTPHAVALKIYEILLQALQVRKLKSEFLREFVYFCSNQDGYECTVERGCCKRRRFMIAMVEKIISWLTNHESELEGIDYADDIELKVYRKRQKRCTVM